MKEEKDLLLELIRTRFPQNGGGKNTIKTSAEIARDFSQFLDATAEMVTKRMLQEGYELIDIDGRPYWKLNAADELSDDE
jgi:hypothetical protein